MGANAKREQAILQQPTTFLFASDWSAVAIYDSLPES